MRQHDLHRRLGLNDLCVKSRWKPTVTPWLVTEYITTTIEHVAPAQPAAPGDRHGRQDREERHGDEQRERDLLPAGLDVLAERRALELGCVLVERRRHLAVL